MRIVQVLLRCLNFYKIARKIHPENLFYLNANHSQYDKCNYVDLISKLTNNSLSMNY